MENLIQSVLYFHAFSGAVALISGIVAIISKKGRKTHILSGKFYFWSMLSVIITGLIVGSYRGNLFLQLIAIFSFYMAFTGKQVLRNKKEFIVKPIDWGVNIISLMTGLFMLYLVIINIQKVGFAGVIPMLLVFGFLLSWMAAEDLNKMRKKKFVKNDWLYTHIGRMGGSFIATSTAFLLVNISFEPRWVVWLAPTAIGTPLIIAAIAKWKKKLEPKKVNSGI